MVHKHARSSVPLYHTVVVDAFHVLRAGTELLPGLISTVAGLYILVLVLLMSVKAGKMKHSRFHLFAKRLLGFPEGGIDQQHPPHAPQPADGCRSLICWISCQPCFLHPVRSSRVKSCHSGP